MKHSNYFLKILFFTIFSSTVFAQEYAVSSPDGQVRVSFELNNSKLFYKVSKDSKPILISADGFEEVEVTHQAESKGVHRLSTTESLGTVNVRYF